MAKVYKVSAKWCDACKFPMKTNAFKCPECGGSLRLERDEPKAIPTGWSAQIGDYDCMDRGALIVCHQVKEYIEVRMLDRTVAIWHGKQIFATVRGFQNNKITINLNETHKQWKQLAPTLKEAMQIVGLKATA